MQIWKDWMSVGFKVGMNVGLEGLDGCRFGRMGWMQVWKDGMNEGLEGWDECRFGRMG